MDKLTYSKSYYFTKKQSVQYILQCKKLAKVELFRKVAKNFVLNLFFGFCLKFNPLACLLYFKNGTYQCFYKFPKTACQGIIWFLKFYGLKRFQPIRLEYSLISRNQLISLIFYTQMTIKGIQDLKLPFLVEFWQVCVLPNEILGFFDSLVCYYYYYSFAYAW